MTTKPEHLSSIVSGWRDAIEEEPTDQAYVRYILKREVVEEPTEAARIQVVLGAELKVPGRHAVHLLDVVVFVSAALAMATGPTMTFQWLSPFLPEWATMTVALIQIFVVGGLATIVLRRRRRR